MLQPVKNFPRPWKLLPSVPMAGALTHAEPDPLRSAEVPQPLAPECHRKAPLRIAEVRGELAVFCDQCGALCGLYSLPVRPTA